MNHALERATRSAALAALENAHILNELDGQAGDGDLGVTMTTAARTVIELLPTLEAASAADVLHACGAAVAREAPSTSGTLVAMGLLRAARIVAEGRASSASVLARALEAASVGIAQRGGAEPGSKTMLDALVPAAQAAADAVTGGQNVEEVIMVAAAAADAGARKTSEMLPRHGRAGWLPDRSVGHEDAGARLIAILLAAVAASLAGPTSKTSADREGA